jgi:RimJ/RimL family protein N-acetyltransferase
MEYQAYISQEMQDRWFSRIHTIEHYYFVILERRKPVGLIHLSGVDDQTGQAGLFIGETKYQGSTVPIRASLSLLDFAFNTLYLKNVTAKVKRDNLAAIQYNSALGFRGWKAAEHPDFYWMKVEQEMFISGANALKNAAALLGDAKFQLTLEKDQALDFKIGNDLQRRRAIRGGNSLP